MGGWIINVRYAICGLKDEGWLYLLYYSGHIAERMDLRYYLTLGSDRVVLMMKVDCICCITVGT